MLQPLANYASFARIILFHLVYVHRSQNIYGFSPLNTISKWWHTLNMRIFVHTMANITKFKYTNCFKIYNNKVYRHGRLYITN